MKPHRAANARPARASAVPGVLIALLLLLALPACLCSCGKDREEETPVGLICIYNGPDITVTDHVFEKSDFQVLASYADGRDEFVSDFGFEQLSMSQGYYVFRISYHGFETETYIQCHASFFPSDKAAEEGTEG